MQVRLAFAVAAHLQPEILLVDEVLAVGDAQFQQKSLGKMESVTNEGRTVVFVSHNLAAVRRLCPRSLVLERGRLVFDGDTDKAIERYLANEIARSDGVLDERAITERWGGVGVLFADRPFFRCLRMTLSGEDGQTRTTFRSDEEFTLTLDWEALRDLPYIRIFVQVFDRNEVCIMRTETLDDPLQPALFPFRPGRYRSSVTFPPNLFGETTLRLNVAFLSDGHQLIDYDKAFELSISFTGLNGNMRGYAHLRPQLPWQTDALADELAARL
jgi:lipopolysaccharide transport system ATP-binding protein